MEYPKFKVCVRCFTFNHSKYITDAMNGFVMQQTDFPFVCCIVDDASTDGEQDVIKKYVEEKFDFSEDSCHFEKETDYAFITYVQHKTNKNCYFVVLYLKENHYNIKKPKQPYLVEWADKCVYQSICEGDDWWIDPIKLQRQVEFLDAHSDFSLCGTNGLVLYDQGKSYPSYFNRIFESRELLPCEIIGGWPFPTASLVFRTSVYYNWPKWTSKIYSGDQTLILIAMSKGKIYGMGSVSTVYRKNDNPYSATNSLSKKGKSFVPEQHKILYEYYDEYSDGRFSKEIKLVINNLDKRIGFYKMQEKCRLLVWMRYPKMSIVMWLKRKKQPLLQKLYCDTILK